MPIYENISLIIKQNTFYTIYLKCSNVGLLLAHVRMASSVKASMKWLANASVLMYFLLKQDVLVGHIEDVISFILYHYFLLASLEFILMHLNYWLSLIFILKHTFILSHAYAENVS